MERAPRTRPFRLDSISSSVAASGNNPGCAVCRPAAADVVTLPGREACLRASQIVHQRGHLVNGTCPSHRDRRHHRPHRQDRHRSVRKFDFLVPIPQNPGQASVCATAGLADRNVRPARDDVRSRSAGSRPDQRRRRGCARHPGAAAGGPWSGPVPRDRSVRTRLGLRPPGHDARADPDHSRLPRMRWRSRERPSIAFAWPSPRWQPTCAGSSPGSTPEGNLGTDVHISGTVAAVREAAIHGVPGIALSHYIARGQAIDWHRAAGWASRVLRTLMACPWEPGTFWNVNLPHLPPGDIEPAIVFCPLDPSPLPLGYRLEGEVAIYTGDYQRRARRVGADVSVCFGGQISATLMRVADPPWRFPVSEARDRGTADAGKLDL